MALEWERKGKWYIRSTCGQYQIAKYQCAETPRYLVWFDRLGIGPRCDSTEQAMEVAEAHALCPPP